MALAGAEVDAETRAWIRNRSDERAVEAGCRFDPERGAYVVFWIERYCKLYEGEWAGQPVELRGCHRCCDYGLPAASEFDSWEDAKPSFLERVRRYGECIAAGHPVDWQLECTVRIFGWVRHSEQWGREVRRFRQAVVFVSKKNKKTPTAAAWGLYLTCGDGEPGQKVFVCAKDGTQARKMTDHARQMLLQSDELLAECKVNENLMRLSHLPTRSYMEPLSSSNSRTQESKEGLNGSVLIDEVHVVDRDLVRRISRAGISRSEPLQIEVSTAGNNPDGYGYERFSYAQKVERGQVENQDLFVAIYAAPQDLSDEELAAAPLKYGLMANPAMGHTVDPEEYLADYRASKKSIQDLLDFKMYRLNIWQRAAAPWLKVGDWEKCRASYAEADLLGRSCWAALDLSRKNDMSALSLCFPWPEDGPEVYRFLSYFWLPEARVEELFAKVPDIRAWVRDGWLEATPGNVIDYGFIKARFRDLAGKFEIQELAFDPRFAEEVTQSLEQGEADDQGRTIVQGTGVPRFVFDQSHKNFAAPTQDYERMVIAGTLRHDGNPVLAWQAGHATLVNLPSKMQRVVKPTKDPRDPRTIDGIVSGIMALARAMMGNEDESWYTPGCLR